MVNSYLFGPLAKRVHLYASDSVYVDRVGHYMAFREQNEVENRVRDFYGSKPSASYLRALPQLGVSRIHHSMNPAVNRRYASIMVNV